MGLGPHDCDGMDPDGDIKETGVDAALLLLKQTPSVSGDCKASRVELSPLLL